MKTIEQIHTGEWEKADPSQADIEAELKDIVEPIVKEHADRLDAKIREAMEKSTTGFWDKKEVHDPVDFSEVANQIWTELHKIDDSPIAQIIHGAIYGVTDQAVELGAAIYALLEERFGETLTTTINDVDAYSRLIDPMIKEAQAEVYEELFNIYAEQNKYAPDPEPEDIYPDASPEEIQRLIGYDDGELVAVKLNDNPPPLQLENKSAIPLSDLVPDKDYLQTLVTSDTAKEQSNGLER